MTFGELTEKLSMEEFHMWLAYYQQRAEHTKQDDGNLVGKSDEDFLKGFGL
jgi:hypothetical protein